MLGIIYKEKNLGRQGNQQLLHAASIKEGRKKNQQHAIDHSTMHHLN